MAQLRTKQPAAKWVLAGVAIILDIGQLPIAGSGSREPKLVQFFAPGSKIRERAEAKLVGSGAIDVGRAQFVQCRMELKCHRSPRAEPSRSAYSERDRIG